MERRKSLSVAHKSSPVRSRLHVQLVKSVPPYDYEMLLSQFNWWAWEEQQRAHFSWNNLTKESPEVTIYLEDSQWVVWAKFQKKTLSEHLSKQDWDLLQNQMEHLLTMIVQHHLPFSLEDEWSKTNLDHFNTRDTSFKKQPTSCVPFAVWQEIARQMIACRKV